METRRVVGSFVETTCTQVLLVEYLSNHLCCPAVKTRYNGHVLPSTSIWLPGAIRSKRRRFRYSFKVVVEVNRLTLVIRLLCFKFLI